jgi:hypothetical protein
MKKNRVSIPWPQYIFVFVVFIIILILGYIFQDALRETVLVNVLHAIWVLDLAIKSVDQDNLWMLALVITLFWMIISISQKFEEPIPPPKAPFQGHLPAAERIPFWRGMIKVRESVAYRPKYFRPEVNWLIIKTLTYHENSNTEDVKDRLRSGELVVPPEVHDVLGMGVTQSGIEEQGGITERITLRFQLFRERFKTQKYIPDPRLEKVATYLESLLENTDDI